VSLLVVGAMSDLTRLKREMADLAKDWETSGVFAEPVGAVLTHFAARIKGPAGTPYEGGIFNVDIKIPSQYPFEAPKMRFTTQVWHPNISSQTGAICLDILKDAWSPALTMKTALLSLQALLSAPEPKDPQDAEVATQYLKEPAKWAATAKFWTDTYAKESKAGSDSAIETLTSMGFGREQAVTALKAVGGNVEKAVERLFSSG
jgi:ubiquitin-conjugating enzyme (huntingtin interacting protein 2)